MNPTDIVNQIRKALNEDEAKTATLLRLLGSLFDSLPKSNRPEWIDLELKGYAVDVPVPEYRYLRKVEVKSTFEMFGVSKLFSDIPFRRGFETWDELSRQRYLPLISEVKSDKSGYEAACRRGISYYEDQLSTAAGCVCLLKEPEYRVDKYVFGSLEIGCDAAAIYCLREEIRTIVRDEVTRIVSMYNLEDSVMETNRGIVIVNKGGNVQLAGDNAKQTSIVNSTEHKDKKIGHSIWWWVQHLVLPIFVLVIGSIIVHIVLKSNGRNSEAIESKATVIQGGEDNHGGINVD